VRIPRQVVVDNESAELQIHAFGRSLRRNHDFRASAIVFAEVVDQRGAAIHLRRTCDTISTLVFLQPALVNGGGFLMGVGAGKSTILLA